MHPAFFGRLTRRAKYTVREDGTSYSYGYFRSNHQDEIAEDCKRRCVYCDSHEEEVGGREAMQIDHFRPHSISRFESLRDDPLNFHHACARCNLLKHNHWPSTHAQNSHDGEVGFVDPFGDLRSDYFELEEDGALFPLKGPAVYLIKLLALNRPHLKLLRRRRTQMLALKELREEAKALLALPAPERPSDFEARLKTYIAASEVLITHA